jgi:hypothetical protein
MRLFIILLVSGFVSEPDVPPVIYKSHGSSGNRTLADASSNLLRSCTPRNRIAYRPLLEEQPAQQTQRLRKRNVRRVVVMYFENVTH